MARCEDIQARLSAFVDGEAGADTAEIRAHVETCAACRGLQADLTRLRDAAGALGPVTPPADVWLRIAGQARLDDARQPAAAASAAASATRQWIGLAAALVLITLGVYAVDRMRVPEAPDGNVSASPSVEGVNQELAAALTHYENAISQLKVLVATDSESLDPEVAATFDRSMAVVDAAIAESRAALETEPGSQPARASLLEALSQKVNVLQATVLLINEMRQGDPAGAAEAAAGSSTKSS